MGQATALPPLPAQVSALQSWSSSKQPPAPDLGASGASRASGASWLPVQAAASWWQGPTAGQPTAESRQAAAHWGGLARLSGRKIKGWRGGGGQ